MKKYSLIVLLLVTVVAFSQAKKNYNIGLLVDSQSEESSGLLARLKNEIKAVVGEDATISFPDDNVLINGFSLEKANANYNTLLNGDIDIILAFGLVNNTVISKLKTFEKPTILFGAINKDFDFIDTNKETSVTSNFTYIILPQSYKKDINTLSELTSFTTVGIAIEEGLINVLPFKELFDSSAKTLGVGYKMIPYSTSDDIVKAINSDIDAFYLASGFFQNENDIDKIATKLINEKIP